MRHDLDFAKAKTAVDLLALASRDTQLKKVASTGGGEWAGPCPKCGGKDRFRVQPNQQGGGRWFCRQCSNNRWLDAIDYIKWRENLSTKEAVFQLTVETNSVPRKEKLRMEQPIVDRTLWAQKAIELAHNCSDQLWSDKGKGALTWLIKRGLEPDTIKLAGLGFNPSKRYEDGHPWGLDQKVLVPVGITIPNHDRLGIHAIKIRTNVPANSDHKYLMVKGSTIFVYGGDSCSGALTAFLFESELDALLAWQTGLGVGFMALPAGQTINPEYQPHFDSLEDVLVAYDNDKAGMDAAAKLCQRKGFHPTQPLPQGKDLTEYHTTGGNVLDWLLGELAVFGKG